MKTVKKISAFIITMTMVLPLCSLGMTEEVDAKAKGVYKLEVSRTKCVVVAYKKVKGKWKYQRTMLASPGADGRTPVGTFRMGIKMRWGELMGDVWGQYCSQIAGDILFHSVYYDSHSKADVNIAEFNRLGQPRSHGCVRLAVIDAKWIYDNCKPGTLIKSGNNIKVPKGRPKAYKTRSGWDPTDPDRRNTNFKLRRATIKAKNKTVEYGSSYKLKKGVKAMNPGALEDITDKLKIKSVKKYNGKKYVRAKFSAKKLGKYKVKYTAKYYSKRGYKTIIIDVVDSKKPIITASGYQMKVGDVNAAKGIKAKQRSGENRTHAIDVTILTPGGETKQMKYAEAKRYVFNEEGSYKITYKVKSKYNEKEAAKTITVTVKP